MWVEIWITDPFERVLTLERLITNLKRGLGEIATRNIIKNDFFLYNYKYYR